MANVLRILTNYSLQFVHPTFEYCPPLEVRPERLMEPLLYGQHPANEAGCDHEQSEEFVSSHPSKVADRVLLPRGTTCATLPTTKETPNGLYL